MTRINQRRPSTLGPNLIPYWTSFNATCPRPIEAAQSHDSARRPTGRRFGSGNLLIFAQLSVRRRKGILLMVRLLSFLAFSVLCILPDAAFADQPKSPPARKAASEFSSLQRCGCTWNRPARVVRYRHYRIRTAYLIGYDPLPYRFGSTFVWEPPYRYYRR
jgi:hypothetical protein